MAEAEKKKKGIWSRQGFFYPAWLGGLWHFWWVDSDGFP